MNSAEADAARADVHDHYWRGGFTGHLDARDFSRRCIAAIQSAHVAWWAQNPGARKGNGKPKGDKRAALRAMIAERDGDDCWVCGRELGEDRTIEHVEAVANGGTWAFANLRLAHRHCNHTLGALPVAAKEAARAKLQKEWNDG
jgi:hypothetical protein